MPEPFGGKSKKLVLQPHPAFRYPLSKEAKAGHTKRHGIVNSVDFRVKKSAGKEITIPCQIGRYLMDFYDMNPAKIIHKCAFFIAMACFTLLIFATNSAQATNENWYQKVWCEGMNGQIEVELEEGPRVDCLTQTHAIEMDFAKKWHEAIGQALHYAHLTGKEAGIVLILKSHGDKHHLDNAKTIINTYRLPISLWPLGP
ncbi:hypothetical protein [Parendozoicomonas haliclonae]|uniref:Uncharacterized protein n=1 Tax=Parendozoicomonas haliclonae TaxID=1960125 RepID=A0A1X7ANQ0_9GAMM|nr:hypothetical protein [Parendozoicomonas haliclonae]SMA49728.1 hypothetical protein EHSB41UT_03510 [Parendozoicomonas haliclonae]